MELHVPDLLRHKHQGTLQRRALHVHIGSHFQSPVLWAGHTKSLANHQMIQILPVI